MNELLGDMDLIAVSSCCVDHPSPAQRVFRNLDSFSLLNTGTPLSSISRSQQYLSRGVISTRVLVRKVSGT